MKSDYYRQTGKSLFEIYNDKGSIAEYFIGKKLGKLSGYKKIIYNCYIPKKNSETSEIDVILIHQTGVYVMESKNYSGWIFGNEDDMQWTQVLKSGKYSSQKNRFYNPLKQNMSHVKSLENYLMPLDMYIPIYSCVIFGNSCVLKDVTLTTNNHSLFNEMHMFDTMQNHIDSTSVVLDDVQIDAIYDSLLPLTQISDAEKLKHIYDSMKYKTNRTNRK